MVVVRPLRVLLVARAFRWKLFVVVPLVVFLVFALIDMAIDCWGQALTLHTVEEMVDDWTELFGITIFCVYFNDMVLSKEGLEKLRPLPAMPSEKFAALQVLDGVLPLVAALVAFLVACSAAVVGASHGVTATVALSGWWPAHASAVASGIFEKWVFAFVFGQCFILFRLLRLRGRSRWWLWKLGAAMLATWVLLMVLYGWVAPVGTRLHDFGILLVLLPALAVMVVGYRQFCRVTVDGMGVEAKA